MSGLLGLWRYVRRNTSTGRLRALAAALLTAAGESEADTIRLCDVAQMVASLQDRLQEAQDEIERALAELWEAEHSRERSVRALRVVPPSCDSTA